MRAVVITGLLAVVFAVLGCGGGGDNTAPPPDNTPAKPPVNWDDQADHDWVHRSQYKQHMRHLWIDCNRIVSAGRGDLEPTWHEILASASDIKRRAEDFAEFWSEIDESGGGILECVEDEDRIGATREYQRMGAACDACHMATWSPMYLHITSEEMANWNNNKPSHPGTMIEQENPPPTLPNREAMKTLFFNYRMVELKLQNWAPEEVKEYMTPLRAEAAKRAQRWKTVAEQAGVIAGAAKSRKRDGMKEAYGTLTLACLQCHSENVGPMREIMIPMPWDGPVK
jgi:hypothetical protein